MTYGSLMTDVRNTHYGQAHTDRVLTVQRKAHQTATTGDYLRDAFTHSRSARKLINLVNTSELRHLIYNYRK